jgi:hypothetical protein
LGKGCYEGSNWKVKEREDEKLLRNILNGIMSALIVRIYRNITRAFSDFRKNAA